MEVIKGGSSDSKDSPLNDDSISDDDLPELIGTNKPRGSCDTCGILDPTGCAHCACSFGGDAEYFWSKVSGEIGAYESNGEPLQSSVLIRGDKINARHSQMGVIGPIIDSNEK